NHGADLTLELRCAACAVPDRTDQLAADADASALLRAGEPASDPIEPDDAIQATRRQLEVGPEVVQVPAQALLVFGARPDEILAVVEQQLQIQGRLVEMGDGQGVGALTQRRPRHRQGIDRIGLARSALAAAAFAHQLRGDTDHSLAGIHQEALKGAGDVTAVLDCPGPLWVKTAAPVEKLSET